MSDCVTMSVWRICMSVDNRLIKLHTHCSSEKFEVYMPFHFEAVDPGTITACKLATYAIYISGP